METNFQIFCREFNEAFVKGNASFILESVTDDVSWQMVGTGTISGKDALKETLGNMDDTNHFNLVINHIITHGKEAAVNGTIEVEASSGEHKNYSFCDIYKVNKHKNGKIKEIISYVIEL